MQPNMQMNGGMSYGGNNQGQGWPPQHNNNGNKGRKNNYPKYNKNNQNQQQQLINSSIQQDSRSGGHGSHNHGVGGPHGDSDVGSSNHHDATQKQRILHQRPSSGNQSRGGNQNTQHGRQNQYGQGYIQFNNTSQQVQLNQQMINHPERQDRNIMHTDRQYNQGGYTNNAGGNYYQRHGHRGNNNNNTEANNSSTTGGQGMKYSQADQDQIWKHDKWDQIQNENNNGSSYPHYEQYHYNNAGFTNDIAVHDNNWHKHGHYNNKHGAGKNHKFGRQNNQGGYYDQQRFNDVYDKDGGRDVRYNKGGNVGYADQNNRSTPNNSQFQNRKKGNHNAQGSMNMKSNALNYSMNENYYNQNQDTYGHQYDQPDRQYDTHNTQQRKMSNSGAHYQQYPNTNERTDRVDNMREEQKRDTDGVGLQMGDQKAQQVSNHIPPYERKQSFNQPQDMQNIDPPNTVTSPMFMKSTSTDSNQPSCLNLNPQAQTLAQNVDSATSDTNPGTPSHPLNSMAPILPTMPNQNFNLAPLQGLQVQGVQSNIKHMMPQNGLITLLQIAIKLQNKENITILITEDPSPNVQPLNFYDIQSQITFQLSQYKKKMMEPTEKPKTTSANTDQQQLDKTAAGQEAQSQQTPVIDQGKELGTPSKKSGKKSQQIDSGQKITTKNQNALIDNQDLIEAFEFYVKRQLQIYNMNKYQQIAHNTQKIQHMQNLQNIQNIASLQNLQQQMTQMQAQQIQQFQQNQMQQQNQQNQTQEAQKIANFANSPGQKSNAIEILLAEQLNYVQQPAGGQVGAGHPNHQQVFPPNQQVPFAENMQFPQTSMQSQPFYPNTGMIPSPPEQHIAPQAQPAAEKQMAEQSAQQPQPQNIIQYNAQNVNFIQFSQPPTSTMPQQNMSGTPTKMKSEEKDKPYDQAQYLQQMLIKQQKQQEAQ